MSSITAPTPLHDPRPRAWSGLWHLHSAALLTAACAVLVLGGVWTAASPVPFLSTALYVAGFLAGGLRPAHKALRLLVTERELDVDLLMVLAATGAAAIGYWWDGGVLIFIFSLANTLETYAMARTQREISALLTLRPTVATRIRPDGEMERVPAASLQVGDEIMVRPGERMAADGEVLQGESAVDQAAITGESVPVDKGPGAPVFAGTINGHGALLVRVRRAPDDTVISRIIRMVAEAREEKPPLQRTIEKFERIYSRLILAAATLMALVPPLLLGWEWSQAWYAAMVLLVAAAPCAVAMAVMPALMSGIANAARSGVLCKGGRHLENLGAVKCVALDKTGTLTRGEPVVTDVIACGAWTQAEILRVAGSIESHSEHPLAAAITKEALARDLVLEEPRDLQAQPGLGVTACLADGCWRIGKPALFTLPPATRELVSFLEEQGKTVVVLGLHDAPAGILALRDELRPGAARAVADLQALGLHVVMLTGDNPRTAAALAEQAGITDVKAGLLPEEKVIRVKELMARYGRVAMVGDGVNDAPALALATVGVAMGRRGSDVAMETADVVLMGDEIGRLAGAIRLGRRAGTTVLQNLVFATGMIAVLVVTALTGVLNLPLGVVGHEGTTLVVTLNGLRLLRRVG